MKKSCKHCQKEFVPERAIAAYCSLDCRIDGRAVLNRAARQRAPRPRMAEVVRMDVFERDGFSCVYCGKSSYEDRVILEVDHLIPISGGGTEATENLVTACRSCNHAKGTRIIAEEIRKRIEIRTKKSTALHVV